MLFCDGRGWQSSVGSVGLLVYVVKVRLSVNRFSGRAGFEWFFVGFPTCCHSHAKNYIKLLIRLQQPRQFHKLTTSS